LAAFLGRETGATEDLQGFVAQTPGASFLDPSAVLFNGGVFKAPVLQERVLEVLNQWLVAEDAPVARLLDARDLDLAVARWGFKPYAWEEAGSFVNWYGKFLAHLYVAELSGREQKKETEGMSCLMAVSRRAVEKQADEEIVGFLQGTIDEVEGNKRKGT
jgi:hypothetical protein